MLKFFLKSSIFLECFSGHANCGFRSPFKNNFAQSLKKPMRLCKKMFFPKCSGFPITDPGNAARTPRCRTVGGLNIARVEGGQQLAVLHLSTTQVFQVFQRLGYSYQLF